MINHNGLPKGNLETAIPILNDTVVKDHTSHDLGHFPYHTMPTNDRFLYACPLFNSSRMPDARVYRNLSFGIDQLSFHWRSDFLFQELYRGRQQLPCTVIFNFHPLLGG